MRQGEWCSTPAGCHAFTSSDVCSSRFTVDPSAPSFNSSRFAVNWFQGLLSANRSINPVFYSFNVAELLYCDGGLYAGTAGRVPVRGSKEQFIYSEGDKIWKAVFQGKVGGRMAARAGGCAPSVLSALHCTAHCTRHCIVYGAVLHMSAGTLLRACFASACLRGCASSTCSPRCPPVPSFQSLRL